MACGASLQVSMDTAHWELKENRPVQYLWSELLQGSDGELGNFFYSSSLTQCRGRLNSPGRMTFET